MIRRRLTPLLLIASLFFGLWTAALHGPDHAGLAAHADACVVCAFVGAAGGGLATTTLALLLAVDAAVIAPAAQPTLRLTRRDPIRVRGPPSLLA